MTTTKTRTVRGYHLRFADGRAPACYATWDAALRGAAEALPQDVRVERHVKDTVLVDVATHRQVAYIVFGEVSS
jgi:hypothetical protein